MLIMNKRAKLLLLLLTVIICVSGTNLYAKDIMFLLPKSLKVSTHTVLVKGVIMDFDVKEVDIFKKFCPIPLPEVQEISHVILMQMLPALVEEDLESFGKAINHFQLAGFKRREVELQPKPVLDIMNYMQNNGASGAGISSFGPVVYGIVGSPAEGKKLQQEVQQMLNESLGGKVLLTKAKNHGADIFGGPD